MPVECATHMKPAVSVLATKIVDYGLLFVASGLIARYLGPSDKGVLAFATLVIAWVTTFGDFNLTDATVYLVGKGDYSGAQALSAALWFSILAGGVILIIFSCRKI
jgi:O-antigen/teichoic acid export membrane protein